MPPGVGAAYFSEDGGVVRIPDAEVEADVRDRLLALAPDVERVRVQLDESVGFPPVEHGLHQS